ncbi:MAG: putative transposase [Psychromonas sp.]|jgi:putative transposase|uniref:transposase n=1 Tax=Psychromonas sp. TaxID=1884585 RepID=UPI0039E33357
MICKSLFHIDQINTIQFVTFRTQESIADYLQKNITGIERSTSELQLKQDDFLDNSSAGALLNGELITQLLAFFKSKNTIYYHLIAVSIMPNHVHLLFKQILPLVNIMQKTKGASAFLVNKYCQRKGILWDRGYFDKVVRTERQFQITYQYIKNNALKAGLKDAKQRFYGIYEDQ